MKNRDVSWTEISAWCTCRMKWHWAYEVNIVPKRVVRAVSAGACGHAAIAAVLRGEDWVQAVNDWLDQEISKVFEEEQEECRAIADLILSIIPRYLDNYHDDFKPVLIEHRLKFQCVVLECDL